MKKFFLLALLPLFCSLSSVAQKTISEGKIVFEITYPDVELDQQTMAMLPDASTFYFNSKKSRVEVKMAMGSTIMISDLDSQKFVTLMDIMGNKMALTLTKEDIDKEKNSKPKPTVQVTRDTKVIAGHLCTKAIITPADTTESMPYEVWFTKDILAKNSFRSNIEGIDGFLMEFRTRQNNMTMKMTCKSVTEQKVDDSMFIIPEGYKPVTMEDLKSMRR
jgi:GLPGLI family protein